MQFKAPTKYILIMSLFSIIETLPTLKCASSEITESFTRGDQITLCLHFIDSSTSAAYRLAFQLKVDRYTALQAYNGYSNLTGSGVGNMTLAIQANKDTITSADIPFIMNSTLIFPIFSVVIYMENGNVTEIIWDNGCWSGSSQCYEYTAGSYADSNNYLDKCTTISDCDPKVYVSFIGTDKSGNYMESAGRRISRFRQYSVGDMYNSAKSVFGNYVDQAKSGIS